MVGIRFDQDGRRNLPGQAFAEFAAPAAFGRCEEHHRMVDLGTLDELLGGRPDLAITIEQFAFGNINGKRARPCLWVNRGCGRRRS